jgi:hypothetical protein
MAVCCLYAYQMVVCNRRSRPYKLRKYLDLDKFIKFKVIDGNLNWDDYDLIFPVADLYEGKI